MSTNQERSAFKLIGITPNASRLCMAKVDDKDNATPPHTFSFLMKSYENDIAGREGGDVNLVPRDLSLTFSK